MLATVGAFWCYRTAIISHPRNPPQLKPFMLIRRPFLFLFHPFYRNVVAQDFWFPGLSLLILLIGYCWLRWRKTPQGQVCLSKTAGRWAVVSLMAGVVILYCALTYSVADAFWFLFDPALHGFHIIELGAMSGTAYSVYLVWKYRRQEPTLLAFTLVVLSCAPVFTYIGWHYTIPGWIFRSAYWPLVIKLVWIELGRPQITTLSARSQMNSSAT